MAYPIEFKEQVIAYRKKGYSLNELHRRFKISKGNLSIWLRDIELSTRAQKRLLTKITNGQYIGAKKRREKTLLTEKEYFIDSLKEIKGLSITENYSRLICGVMYWCEGTKNPRGGMTFINSDPAVIRKFLFLLRKSFSIDERKFHPCIHLHAYHDVKKQLDFWSKITHINKDQFIKSYIKPNTGKRIRENYQGCISLRYGSNDFGRRLLAIGKAFLVEGV